LQTYFLRKKPEDVLLFLSSGYETTGQSLVRFGIIEQKQATLSSESNCE
jgi:hypothetical protein